MDVKARTPIGASSSRTYPGSNLPKRIEGAVARAFGKPLSVTASDSTTSSDRAAQHGLRDPGNRIMSAGIVLVLLYVGRDVRIPLALAIMLSFLVDPLVRALRRIGIGRTPSVLIAVLTVAVSCMAVAVALGIQTLRLAESLPQYEATVQRSSRPLTR